MRLPRSRLGALILAVAGSALLWGGLAAIRWMHCQDEIRGATRTREICLHMCRRLEEQTRPLTSSEAGDLAFWRQMTDYWTRQEARYKRGIRRPWLFLGPEPSRPPSRRGFGPSF